MNTISRKTHVLDAAGQSVGRLATRVVLLLRGKHKTDYLPRLDAGDVVQVINADQLKFSGKKLEQKKYYSYSGYPGGLKKRKLSDTNPAEALRKAVKNMLPPNKQRVAQLKRLIIK